ncbi:uncharacterized protein LOC121420550 [Lytechinus variegatus]|uniref:uncharacterized protein LOC121420550 n=1 Tax=Lytechinus variegatus TaxID=7654 RepID=UPI001BB20BBC|nr:uncharacterized protein LOC121420550 [Lytechinus variegatus]
MDLKPTNPTSTAEATSEGTGDHNYDTPEGSNALYMNTDMTDGPVLEERSDHVYVSPGSSPKGSECHYVNADVMVSRSESDDHLYINQLPSEGKDGDCTTAHVYMDMKPMQIPSTSLSEYSMEDDLPDKEEAVYANT